MAAIIDTRDLDENKVYEEINKLVRENRLRCFWHTRDDYLPETTDSRFRALKTLATYGDRATFVKARNLRDCLQQITSETCAER
jgi:hypothetical protein